MSRSSSDILIPRFMYDISRYTSVCRCRWRAVGNQRYVFEYARFMRVLVTHHLHGRDEMEGRAPDAERAFRRCDDCATIPAPPQFAVDLGRDRDAVVLRPWHYAATANERVAFSLRLLRNYSRSVHMRFWVCECVILIVSDGIGVGNVCTK